MDKKITLPELVSIVAESTNTTKRMSELFLRELLATVSQALIEGDNVTIKNLGSFKIVKSSASANRRGKSANDIIFVPDKKLAEAVNQPFEAFVPVELCDELNDERLAQIDEEIETIPPVAEESETGTEDNALSEIETKEPDVIIEPVPETDETPSDVADDLETPVMPVADETSEASPLLGETPQQPENSEATGATEGPVNEIAEPSKSNKSFIWGLFTGIAAAVIAALICWGIWGRTASDDKNAVPADTIANTVVDKNQSAEKTVSPAKVTKQVTDTCSKRNHLKRMARKHYGSHAFWVYIYEENNEIIDNPYKVEPGTVVVIPPAEKYGIDASSSESLKKARHKNMEIEELFSLQSSHQSSHRRRH